MAKIEVDNSVWPTFQVSFTFELDAPARDTAIDWAWDHAGCKHRNCIPVKVMYKRTKLVNDNLPTG